MLPLALEFNQTITLGSMIVAVLVAVPGIAGRVFAARRKADAESLRQRAENAEASSETWRSERDAERGRAERAELELKAKDIENARLRAATNITRVESKIDTLSEQLAEQFKLNQEEHRAIVDVLGEMRTSIERLNGEARKRPSGR